MSKTTHQIYISIMAGVVILTTIFLAYKGYSYYSTPFEERFYHPDHENFKAAGLYGHGLGFVGTFLILFGVVMYIVRKRYKFFARWGRLKYWLEFHIFLCTLGPVMILFHTAFKFGGIVSIAFWSMVAVVLSGVIGRFIYIQIPRSIEGRELSIQEIQGKREQHVEKLKALSNGSISFDDLTNANERNTWGPGTYFKNRVKISNLKKSLDKLSIGREDKEEIVAIAKDELYLSSRIGRLQQMQNLFKYWHVVHMPFAIIMVIIVLIHVGVAFTLGYNWIF